MLCEPPLRDTVADIVKLRVGGMVIDWVAADTVAVPLDVCDGVAADPDFDTETVNVLEEVRVGAGVTVTDTLGEAVAVALTVAVRARESDTLREYVHDGDWLWLPPE